MTDPRVPRPIHFYMRMEHLSSPLSKSATAWLHGICNPQSRECLKEIMRNHGKLFTFIILVLSQKSRALVSWARPATVSRSVDVDVYMSSGSGWGDLLGAMNRASGGAWAVKRDDNVLTPKSRVKLGDISVSPMGACRAKLEWKISLRHGKQKRPPSF